MFANAKRIVIKIGSALLTDEGGNVQRAWLATVAQDIRDLLATGTQVIIVTSGAVALGRLPLGFAPGEPLALEEKQAAAACGQIALLAAWRDALAVHGLPVAQLLLTADDSSERKRYLNARNTLDTLLERGAIPIINENDTVATAELRFGDNDRLSARIAQMAGAEWLVLFSDIDGLYSADPRSNPQAAFIDIVDDITPEIERMASGSGSHAGTGGMVTKLLAAKIAMQAGCHMVIARGTVAHPLRALRQGARATRFIARVSPLSARQHWIAGSLHPAGSVVVDDGAFRALQSGKSLLPAGVTGIEGAFGRGDTVAIKDSAGRLIGQGLIAYASDDAQRILGRKSQDIERILGFRRRDVLIHRDDMVLNII